MNVARSATTIHRLYLKLQVQYATVFELPDAQHLVNLFEKTEGIYDVVHFLDIHHSILTEFIAFLVSRVEKTDDRDYVIKDLEYNLALFLRGRKKKHEDSVRAGKLGGQRGGQRGGKFTD